MQLLPLFLTESPEDAGAPEDAGTSAWEDVPTDSQSIAEVEIALETLGALHI